MQEISENVFIETDYAGVTLGAINWDRGLVLIDAPFRIEDMRVWRAAISILNNGIDRMLVNLDAHYDRTLGARAMECTIVGHEIMANAFRSRSMTFKAQNSETGAEWESYTSLGSIRWAPPEITFSQSMQIQWEGRPLLLEHRPGPSTGAIWAVLPQQKIAFVGDAVIAGQPPFLANADLPAWISLLKMLLTPEYQGYMLISGRGGQVTLADVETQITMLESLHTQMEALAHRKSSPEDTAALVPGLLKQYSTDSEQRPGQYQQRLRVGLQNYFIRRYRSAGADLED